MTVKELYDWAVKNKAEHLQIEIPHNDFGYYLEGYFDCRTAVIEAADNDYNGERAVHLYD